MEKRLKSVARRMGPLLLLLAVLLVVGGGGERSVIWREMNESITSNKNHSRKPDRTVHLIDL